MKKSSMLLMALAVASTSAFAQKAPKIGVVIYKFDDTFMSYVRGKIESEAKAAGVGAWVKRSMPSLKYCCRNQKPNGLYLWMGSQT